MNSASIPDAPVRLTGVKNSSLASLVIFRLLFIFGAVLSQHATAVENAAWHAARTLFQERCTKCHGGAEQKGGLDLRSEQSVLQGGSSGPAVEAGDPQASLLLEMVVPDAETRMPPKGAALTDDQVALLNAWISQLGNTSEDMRGKDTFPQGLSPELVIDFALERAWRQGNVEPSARITDAHFVRRTTLDLLGRTPTQEERQSFLLSTDSAKRTHLVDALLESSEHARHLAEIFDMVLLGRSERMPGMDRPMNRDASWHRYLHWAFSSNRPWNEIVRDLINARPASEIENGASWYLYAHKNDHQAIATSVAPKLLGKQIACAQCHDHPIIPEIEQGHYWAMVAFFNRSYNVETPHGPRLGEHAVGGNIQFSNLKSESFDAKLAFLTGENVEQTEPEEHTESLYRTPPPASFFEALNQPKGEHKKKNRKGTPKFDEAPVPHFSRREELARVAIERNSDFAKAFVNRIWALLLGRGFVHPVEHIDSIHPPSHPELLDWLSKDFAKSGYDVRRLIGAIMASKAYQLDSIPSADKRPPAESFACGITKPLSAETLYRSMLIALGHVPSTEGTFAHVDEKALRSLVARVYPDVFPETFSPRATEALLYSNNEMVDALMNFGDGSLLQTLREQTNVEDAVQHAFLRVYGRTTAPDELAACSTFVSGNPERFKHLLWSLITSSEFRFNH